MRTYKRREEANNQDPYRLTELPKDKPCAVYYRQSGEAQVGNISTTLQTVDMVEHLVRLGWAQESIIMIDMDAGVSGTKKMEERPGMSQVMTLIENQQIGLVAAQDVDRFFRDVTQIEPNIFIDVCRRNNVLVLTPTMIFDFAHPLQGRFHMQMFREHAQRAADYLEYHVRGRLVKSRHWRSERGMWAGRKIAPGYMVDNRKTLPNGERNPSYRYYVPFEPFAQCIRAYFKLFQEYNGSQEYTWTHIQEQGPFFPEFSEDMLPDGFIFRMHVTHRSKQTGKLCPSRGGLRFILTNVAYLGHWIHQEAIVEWDNHEPLVEHDLFMFAYNALSKTDFYGEPNPEYAPFRDRRRQPKETRDEPYPTYAGLMFSDDIQGLPHRRLAAIWYTWGKGYAYQLYVPSGRSNVWNIKAKLVDPVIDEMLLARLQSTVVDEALWQAAISNTHQGNFEDIRRLENEIRQEKQAQDNIIATLGKLTNEEMIHRAQAQYEAAARRIEMLKAQVELLHSDKNRQRTLTTARPALERIAANWDLIPRAEKRNIFQEFAEYIKVTRLSRHEKEICVQWRDGSTSSQVVTRYNWHGHYWNKADIEQLCQMMDANMHQVDILRAFPGYTFRTLLGRYAIHGTADRKYSHYQGERPYGVRTRWEDTEEYRLEQQNPTQYEETSQTLVFSASIDRLK
ncbi:MAG: recombinase family protein [Anaerolineae bacterium]|nr:MAG: recombinase family protein [Anaerolineae bacterium]